MKYLRNLFIMLFIVAVAVPVAAEAKKKDPREPMTMREALEAAPLFVADPSANERGQSLLNDACAAILDEKAICDLVVKDAEFDGFYFKPDSGIMLTTIDTIDTLKDDELRAGFAWSIAYADGLRAKAAKMQKDRLELLQGLAKVNPSVGVGSVRVGGNVAVGVGVGLGPAAVVSIIGGVSEAVEDAKLQKELRALDAEVVEKLDDAGFGRKGLAKLLKRVQGEGDHYLADREIGIGHVDDGRLRKLKEE